MRVLDFIDKIEAVADAVWAKIRKRVLSNLWQLVALAIGVAILRRYDWVIFWP